MEFKNLKEKYLVHKKQQKFQVSVLGWTPYSDWHFALWLLSMLILSVGILCFFTYKSVIFTMNNYANVEVAERQINVEGYLQIKQDYDNRVQVLNSLK
jgi:hypothetical protein